MLITIRLETGISRLYNDGYEAGGLFPITAGIGFSTHRTRLLCCLGRGGEV